MHVEWRLQCLPEREGIIPDRLVKESGISRQNLYPLVRGHASAVRAQALIRPTSTLERLPGNRDSVKNALEGMISASTAHAADVMA